MLVVIVQLLPGAPQVGQLLVDLLELGEHFLSAIIETGGVSPLCG